MEHVKVLGVNGWAEGWVIGSELSTYRGLPSARVIIRFDHGDEVGSFDTRDVYRV